MESYFGMKELYQLAIKATNKIVVGGRIIDEGEPITYLRDVKIASLTQLSQPKTARGGRGNLPHIIWEDQEDVILRVTEGIITPIGLALLTNTKLFKNPMNGQLVIPKTEFLTLNHEGKANLKYAPNMDEPIFIYNYNKTIQSRILTASINEQILDCGLNYANADVSIEYKFNYGDNAKVYVLDNDRFNELVTIEGRFYSQDNNTGLRKTNIFTIPKAKIISNLSVRIGEMSDPTISVFQIRALSTSTDMSENCVISITELDSDIDGDF